jgi:hypothetical protein
MFPHIVCDKEMEFCRFTLLPFPVSEKRDGEWGGGGGRKREKGKVRIHRVGAEGKR